MKNVLYTLIFCTFPLYLLGQFNHSIDAVTGVEYSYRSIFNSSQEEIFSDIFKRRVNTEIGKFNWRFGFNYNLEFAPTFFFKTGIRLASTGYKDRKVTDIRWPSEIDDSGNWTPDPDLPRESQTIRDHWFLELPIVGRFQLLDGKLTPFIEFGASPNIYIITRNSWITDISKSITYESLVVHKIYRLHLVGNLSFGFNYSISNSFQIFGQPIFRYHLNPFFNGSIKEHLYNYGIEFGLRKMMSN